MISDAAVNGKLGRMNPLGVVAVAALALLPLASLGAPLTEPIVFDFEGGLQGWEVHGSAQRVQTQLLGGEWAIFGDGFATPIGAAMSNSVDRLAVITFDFLPLGGEFRPLAGVFGLIPPGVIRPVEVLIIWENFTGPVIGFIDNVTITPVPEPSTLALLALGVAALMGRSIRRRG